ncbi:hypothetical protein KBZ10_01455 [Streptomyces sp. F63]|uniref:hypothetical protein n=1 Tax=Streptomyces sp. F63 TaxID=2824887 RepID=UPI001B391189|nr:hypothetical protein [Streptomyces sp. F63]MBQ0983227.1 hypothetical protein [Streptomyces sp. F63]
MTWSNWRRLGPAEGGTTVLAVDFGPGRATAGFGELAPRLTGDWTLWEPRTFTTGSAGDGDPQELVREWASYAAAQGTGVAAVIGYCSGSALACALADALQERGMPRPLLVMFDPDAADAGLIHDYYTTALRSFEGFLPDAELERARDLGDHTLSAAAGAGPDGLTALARVLGAEYERVAAAACLAAGMKPEYGRQLSERLDTFLGYLATTGRVEDSVPARAAARGPVEVIVSRQQTVPARFGAATRAFDVTRAALLDDQAVADTVTALLEREAVR